MARKARPYWSCRCGYRNERLKRKCISCGKAKPKKKVTKSSVNFAERNSYEHYVEVASFLHGVTDERCCVCGKPRSTERRHDRDHDHVTGLPRGLACVVCNKIMVHQITAERAELIAAYLRRAEKYNEVFTKPEGHEQGHEES